MMTSWFKRARQTRTPVHDREAEQAARLRSAAAAYRALGALQLASQLLLWVTFYAYDQTVQTTWQAVAMLVLPLAGLWALWHGGEKALMTKTGARWALALLPCLMLDAALALRSISGYILLRIPQYPAAVCALVPAALCWLAVLLSRENGAAYGAQLMLFLLVALFLLSTTLLNPSVHTAHLWPLLGQGLDRTATVALSGTGAVWGVALMFLLPAHPARGKAARKAPGERPWRGLVFTAVPWVLAVVWALRYGLVRPWRVGDTLAVGERLMGLARHSHSALLYECAGILWMFLLPLSLIGSAASAEKLLRAAAPRIPRSLAALTPLLPAAAAVLIWPDALLNALGWALPWRIVLSAIAGAALCVTAARSGKEAHAG